jgi:hypothetical protein
MEQHPIAWLKPLLAQEERASADRLGDDVLRWQAARAGHDW